MRFGADFDLQSYRPLRTGRALSPRPAARETKSGAVVSVEQIDALIGATRKLGFERATIPATRDIESADQD